jgi:hypothetical protein
MTTSVVFFAKRKNESSYYNRYCEKTMPYEYRKMTPAERAEVVKQRREQGYPYHAPPHPFRQAGCYLITAASFEHANVLSNPARRSEFECDLLVS